MAAAAVCTDIRPLSSHIDNNGNVTGSGRPPSRTRREVLARIGLGAVVWTAPQVISVARAGAATDYPITIDKDCIQTAGGAVPFAWGCTPVSGESDLSDGGDITITTAGCDPIVTDDGLGTQLTPIGNVVCSGGSGGPRSLTVDGTITGTSTASFPRASDQEIGPSEICTYVDFELTVRCSS